MSEAKDPAIKLFGKTIAVPEIPSRSGDSSEVLASSSGGDVVDDSVDQNHASSTNSSRESHTDGDAKEQEIDEKVLKKFWAFGQFLILRVTHYLKW